MIMNELGRVPTPVSVDGVEFPRSPRGHEVHISVPVPSMSTLELVRDGKVHIATDDDERRPYLVMLSCNVTITGTKFLSLDVTGRESRVVVSDVGDGSANAILWVGPGSGAKPDGTECLGYTLADDEHFLNASLCVGMKVVKLHRPATGVTLDTIAKALQALSDAAPKGDAMPPMPVLEYLPSGQPKDMQGYQDALQKWIYATQHGAGPEVGLDEKGLVDMMSACGITVKPEPQTWKKV